MCRNRTIKLVHEIPLGYKINITNSASTNLLLWPLWNWKKNRRIYRREKYFFTFRLYANLSDLTAIWFGSACWMCIKMICWLYNARMTQGETETWYGLISHNYHKPYGCSLWSRCKVKNDDDKQLKHISYHYGPSCFSFLVKMRQGANRISISWLIHL